MSFLLKTDSNSKIAPLAEAMLDAVETAVAESVDLSAFVSEHYASREAFLADVALNIFVEAIERRHGVACGSYALARMTARRNKPLGDAFPMDSGL